MSTGAVLEGATLLAGILRDVFDDDNGIEVTRAQVDAGPGLQIDLHIDSNKGRMAFIALMRRRGWTSPEAPWKVENFGTVKDPLTSLTGRIEIPRADTAGETPDRAVILSVWGALGR